MTDLAWAAHVAVGAQSVLGTPNPTIDGLTTGATSAQGAVLGDGESGDGSSGITIPNLPRISRAVADIGLIQLSDSFLRTAIENFQISIQLKGNGVTSTPSAGQARPLTGIDALLQMSGLIGIDGTNPVVNYTPRITTTIPSTAFGTVKLWVGPLRWQFLDCICESVELNYEPGGIILATFSMKVGSIQNFTGGIALGTFDYTTQATLASPVVQGVASTWLGSAGTDHGFEEFNLVINQQIEEIKDANQSTGVRQLQTRRTIDFSGTFFAFSTDDDAHYQNLIGSAPTSDLIFQVGAVAGAGQVINGIRTELRNIQISDVKYSRRGNAVVAELDGHGTGTAESPTSANALELRFN